MFSLRNWLFGNQNRQFYTDHRDIMYKYNMHEMKLIVCIMMFVPAAFLIYDLIFRNTDGLITNRLAYLAFICVFMTLYIFFDLFSKASSAIFNAFIVFIFQMVFFMLLICGPVFNPGSVESYMPIYFVLVPILTIMPIFASGSMLILDLIPYIITVLYCKSTDIAVIDIINASCCTVLGILIGHRVLKGRLYEIEAYTILKETTETELARALNVANRDTLTGVRSRVAYESTVKRLNSEIADGSCRPFAVVVCDIIGLNSVNEKHGRSAGDRYIYNCGETLTRTFTNSQVFRTGGGEFCVILRGIDFQNCAELMRKLTDPDPTLGKCIFSSGISDFRKSTDSSFEDVWTRADADMYKKQE